MNHKMGNKKIFLRDDVHWCPQYVCDYVLVY